MMDGDSYGDLVKLSQWRKGKQIHCKKPENLPQSGLSSHHCTLQPLYTS